MTFEEFKELALNPPYTSESAVYRVDVYCFNKPLAKRIDEKHREIRTDSYFYLSLEDAKNKIRNTVASANKNFLLFALYLYELPIGKDISDDIFKRVWVYDRKGKLNCESCCSALIGDLDHLSAKFRGREQKSIRFKQGDIVEIFHKYYNTVTYGVIVDTPPTIEECYVKWKNVEKQCKAEGIGDENVDDNYSIYFMDDFYKVFSETYSRVCNNIKTWDVFPVSYPFPNHIREDLLSRYREYIEDHSMDEISSQRDGTVSFDELLDML